MSLNAIQHQCAPSRPLWQGPSPLPGAALASHRTEAESLRPAPARPKAGASPPPGGGWTVSHLAQTPSCGNHIHRRGERQCLSYPAPPA